MIEAIIPRQRTQRSGTPTNDRTDGDVSPAVLADGGEETDEDETESETQVLYLDIEGLFLDVLGLEVDLDQVVLDVTAVPGPRHLLGNLLSSITAVFDDGLSNVIDVSLLDVPSLPSEGQLKDRLPSLSDVVFGAVNVLLDAILDALEDQTEESSDTQQS